jgi:sodium/pantothenate symporter
MVGGSIGWFSTIPVYGIIGLVALAYFPELTGPGADFSVDKSADAAILVYTKFLGGALPQLVFVIVLVALLVSTADSAIAALSSLTTNDIYKANINPDATEEQLFKLARLSVPFWAAVVMIVVWAMFHVDFLTCIWLNGMAFTAVCFPLIYCLFSKRISSNAVFITSFVVFISLAYWFFFSGAVDFSEGTFGDLVPMYIVGYAESLVLPPLLSLIWKDDFNFDTLKAEEELQKA